MVAADFNGDGKLDVALLTNGELNAGSVTILLGNGNGTFQSPVVYSTGSLTGGAVMLAAAFYDDRHLDLAVRGDAIEIFKGNGDGTFAEPVVTPLSGAAVTSMTPADFNQDSKLDLAVCTNNNITYNLYLYLGNGDGTFETHASVATGPSAVASSHRQLIHWQPEATRSTAKAPSPSSTSMETASPISSTELTCIAV